MKGNPDDVIVWIVNHFSTDCKTTVDEKRKWKNQEKTLIKSLVKTCAWDINRKDERVRLLSICRFSDNEVRLTYNSFVVDSVTRRTVISSSHIKIKDYENHQDSVAKSRYDTTKIRRINVYRLRTDQIWRIRSTMKIDYRKKKVDVFQSLITVPVITRIHFWSCAKSDFERNDNISYLRVQYDSFQTSIQFKLMSWQLYRTENDYSFSIVSSRRIFS